MSSTKTPGKFDYVNKIVSLLALGERATTDAEAEAAYGKAAALMAQYQIEQAEIDSARAAAGAPQDKIATTVLWFPGIYAREHGNGAGTVLSALYGQTLFVAISSRLHRDYLRISGETPDSRKGRYVHIRGFDNDIAVARLLVTSVQLQAQTALARWWKVERNFYSTASTTNRRRGYLAGFYHGAGVAILASKTRTMANASRGAELALVDRAALVLASLSDEQRNLRPLPSLEYDPTSVIAGVMDGRNADVAANARIPADNSPTTSGELT